MSAEEIKTFAVRYDPQPFHLDDAAARASIFGGSRSKSGQGIVTLQSTTRNQRGETVQIALMKLLVPRRPR